MILGGLGIHFHADLIFWYPNLLFGMLGGFTLASWGTLGRSWDIGEQEEGHFEVQAWIFIGFVGFRDPT